MKKITILFLFINTLVQLSAQVVAPPQGINYQAVARNSNGKIMANAVLKVKLGIYDNINAATGKLYEEEHLNVPTNKFGLFTLIIGNGSILGTQQFNTIDWGGNKTFLKVELDTAGGSGYALINIAQFMSVPYSFYAGHAKYADSAGNIGSGWSLAGNTPAIGSNPFIGTTNANDFVIKTNGTERIRVDAITGNVGIGVSPIYKLDVDIGGVNSFSGFKYNGTAKQGTFLRGNGNYFIEDSIKVSDLPLLQLIGQVGYWKRDVSNGFVNLNNISDKVGIGTNSPLAKLHIINSSLNTTLQVEANTPNNNNAIKATHTGLATVVDITSSNSVSSLPALNVSTIGNNGSVGIEVKNSGLPSSATTKNYGIKASAISGIAANGENIAGYFSASGANKNWAGYFDDGNVFIKDSIKIGSGQTLVNRNFSLEHIVHIPASNNGSFGYVLKDQNNSLSLGTFIGVNPLQISAVGVGIGSISSSDFHLFTGNASGPTTKMVIKQNGNVGIGSLSPMNSLTVNGSIAVKKISITSNTANTIGINDCIVEIVSPFPTDVYLPSLNSIDVGSVIIVRFRVTNLGQSINLKAAASTSDKIEPLNSFTPVPLMVMDANNRVVRLYKSNNSEWIEW